MDEAQALAWRDSTLVNIFLCVCVCVVLFSVIVSHCDEISCHKKNVCLRQKHNVLNWVIKISCNIVEGQGAKDQQICEGNGW